MLPTEILAPYLVHVPVDLGAAAQALKIDVMAAVLPPGDTIHLELGRGRDARRWRAFLNRTMSRTQVRFATAHVIAHFILHRDLIEPEMAGCRIHREDYRFRSRLDDAIERQASRYAMSLLVPVKHARAIPCEGDEDAMARQIASVFDIALPLARLCVEDYGLLAPRDALKAVVDRRRTG